MILIALVFGLCAYGTVGSRIKYEEVPAKLQYVFKGNISEWEPPKNISRQFPYYLSGYDDEKRPVWILELGRWDIKGAVEAGDESKAMFDRYVDKGIYNILKSVGELDPDNDEDPKEAIGIVDLDAYSFDQLNSIKAISYILRVLRMVLGAAQFVNTVFVVNTNFVAEAALNIIKPVAGKEFEIVEVFGTDPSKYRPILRRKIPPDQLPEWYGGVKGFKPVRVYG